jgi:multiple sugar transport system permease protein
MMSQAQVRPPRHRRRKHRDTLLGFLCISPWIVGFTVLTLGPILASIYFSFTKYGLIGEPKWVGFDNYARMFTRDRLFWKSLSVTFYYSFTSVPLGLIFGLTLALLLNERVKFLSLFRTIYYLPAVLSGVAVAVMWAWVFNPKFGVLNWVLSLVGIKGPGWLADPQWAMPAFIIMSLWGVGGGMLIYLGGLQGIPTDMYDAAKVDGAGRWGRFVHVTLPMLSPVLFYNLVQGVIGSFQVFTPAYVMTSGGPAYATFFYVFYLYQNAFSYGHGAGGMGYASALAWVLFAIIMFFTLLIMRSSGAWVHYEGMRLEGGRRW